MTRDTPAFSCNRENFALSIFWSFGLMLSGEGLEGEFDTSKYLQDTVHDCNMLTMIDSIRFLLHSTVPIKHLLSPEPPNFKALTPNTSTRYGSDQPPAWPFAIELQVAYT
jgi:hypothetical protein